MMSGIQPICTRKSLVTLLVASSLLLPVGVMAQGMGMPDYSYFTTQAGEFLKKGELTKSIEMYEKAIPLAPDTRLGLVYNNLSAIYMKRGNYYNGQKNYKAALSDYRQAYFLMTIGWPEGLEKKELHRGNEKIATDNLKLGYQNNKIKTGDPKLHHQMATELRQQGLFREALVEYSKVLQGNKTHDGSLHAMADLFNVIGRQEKAKKYYNQLTNVKGDDVSDDTLVRLANSQFKSGEVDNAVKTLNQALEKNPGNMHALNQLEKIWLTEIKYNPKSVLGHANLASILQKKKRYREAFDQYQAAEYFANRDPKTPFDVKKMIRLNLGTLYQENGQKKMALQAYDSILKADPNNVTALLYKATLYKETGQTDAARQIYYQILTVDADNQGAHDEVMASIAKLSNPAARAGELHAYGKRFADNSVVQSRVGEEFHRMNDHNNAIIYYKRSLQVKPDVAGVYANLGAAYQSQGNAEYAYDAFKKAQSLAPADETVNKLFSNAQADMGQSTFQKALKLLQQGEYKKSLPVFEDALRMAPDNPDVLANYGIALQNLGRFAEAKTQYEKAIKLDDKNGHYHFYLATVYHQENKLDPAVNSYETALRLMNPNKDGDTYNQAKTALASLKETQANAVLTDAVSAYGKKEYFKALALIQKAISMNPGNAPAYYYRGLIYNDQSKTEEAIQNYQEAIDRQADFKDAYYGLGVALETKKDFLGAKEAFQKFVELSGPTNDEYTQYARERLAEL